MKFSETIKHLEDRYSKLLSENGDGPGAVEQSDQETQEQRMRTLCYIGDLKNAKVLDFGCGTGHLLSVLRNEFDFEGEYVGCDITNDLLQVAREKYPEVRFGRWDILNEGLSENFDYILISGVFNNLAGENWEWMTDILGCLFKNVNKGLAFNNLSRYVDYFDDHLFYVDPSKVFEFCKSELSPLVSLRHDYFVREGTVPYEFSTYVYASDVGCRNLNQAT
ncbi:MAG: class I SAM-dependent methyltransferase [Verrucomicrobiota bacterium]